MHFGIEGYAEEAEDDPFVILGSVLDQPFLAGPICKERKEDLQLWSVLQALAVSGVARHPLGAKVGEDPPDRYLIHGDRAWGTELTELTVQDIRTDLAPVRWFGRKLQERLRAHAGDFMHLHGKTLTLSKMPDRAMPRDQEQLLQLLEGVLREDKGYVGEDTDLSQGLPKQLGTRGIYSDHGPFSVIVNPPAPGVNNDQITVSAFSQSQVRTSEAVAALAGRVAAKDKEGNEVLIVTCGLIDANGYVCPADGIIFELLRRTAEAGASILPLKPTHIRGLLIHQWNSPFLFHWEADNDLPWKTAPQASDA